MNFLRLLFIVYQIVIIGMVHASIQGTTMPGMNPSLLLGNMSRPVGNTFDSQNPRNCNAYDVNAEMDAITYELLRRRKILQERNEQPLSTYEALQSGNEALSSVKGGICTMTGGQMPLRPGHSMNRPPGQSMTLPPGQIKGSKDFTSMTNSSGPTQGPAQTQGALNFWQANPEGSGATIVASSPKPTPRPLSARPVSPVSPRNNDYYSSRTKHEVYSAHNVSAPPPYPGNLKGNWKTSHHHAGSHLTLLAGKGNGFQKGQRSNMEGILGDTRSAAGQRTDVPSPNSPNLSLMHGDASLSPKCMKSRACNLMVSDGTKLGDATRKPSHPTCHPGAAIKQPRINSVQDTMPPEHKVRVKTGGAPHNSRSRTTPPPPPPPGEADVFGVFSPHWNTSPGSSKWILPPQ